MKKEIDNEKPVKSLTELDAFLKISILMFLMKII